MTEHTGNDNVHGNVDGSVDGAAVQALAERLIGLRIPNPLAAGAAHDMEASGVYDWEELQRLAAALLGAMPTGAMTTSVVLTDATPAGVTPSGAPGPAQVWDECTDAHHEAAARQRVAFAHPPNPYRSTPAQHAGDDRATERGTGTDPYIERENRIARIAQVIVGANCKPHAAAAALVDAGYAIPGVGGTS